MMQELPGYMNVKNAAAWASVSVKTLRRWCAEGLPSYEAGPGQKILVRPVDIELFLKRRPVQTADLDSIVNEVLHDLNLGGTSRNTAKR